MHIVCRTILNQNQAGRRTLDIDVLCVTFHSVRKTGPAFICITNKCISIRVLLLSLVSASICFSAWTNMVIYGIENESIVIVSCVCFDLFFCLNEYGYIWNRKWEYCYYLSCLLRSVFLLERIWLYMYIYGIKNV